MTERAAHLVDHVLPADLPVRQWVLSVPHRLRPRLAYDHRLCRTVLHVFVRALRSPYRRAARREGLSGGESGMMTSVQRFGGAVNVHLHFHTLVLDGVYVHEPDGTLRVHAASPPKDEDVRRVVARVRRQLPTAAAHHRRGPCDAHQGRSRHNCAVDIHTSSDGEGGPELGEGSIRGWDSLLVQMAERSTNQQQSEEETI